jgi:hypothetical protein
VKPSGLLYVYMLALLACSFDDSVEPSLCGNGMVEAEVSGMKFQLLSLDADSRRVSLGDSSEDFDLESRNSRWYGS